ncbi:MAG: heterodisulfide reductase-related iron-sulfur binding cluster [Lachnospirales bacterium]
MSRKGFMPGCSLPSYSPFGVQKTLEYLKTVYPDISAIQKCCGKPTLLIGQEEKFQERFNDLKCDIKNCDVDEMIVACQNCHKMLKTTDDFKTKSLWVTLQEIGIPKEEIGKGKGSDVVFAIHDSCSSREYPEIHNAIRYILNELGYKTVETSKSMSNTRCCGFGGMIAPVNYELAQKVMERRVQDFESRYVVTYCAACRQAMIKGGAKSWHILDLIFGPVVYKNDDAPEDVLSNTVKAWSNRYKSKKNIIKTMNRGSYVRK